MEFVSLCCLHRQKETVPCLETRSRSYSWSCSQSSCSGLNAGRPVAFTGNFTVSSYSHWALCSPRSLCAPHAQGLSFLTSVSFKAATKSLSWLVSLLCQHNDHKHVSTWCFIQFLTNWINSDREAATTKCFCLFAHFSVCGKYQTRIVTVTTKGQTVNVNPSTVELWAAWKTTSSHCSPLLRVPERSRSAAFPAQAGQEIPVTAQLIKRPRGSGTRGKRPTGLVFLCKARTLIQTQFHEHVSLV